MRTTLETIIAYKSQNPDPHQAFAKATAGKPSDPLYVVVLLSSVLLE